MHTFPAPSSPRRSTRRSTGAIVALTSVCAVALASLVTVAVLALGGHNIFDHSASASAARNTPAAATTTGHHYTPAVPSASVTTLQRQLGQLNYYEGPVDGLMGPQTTAAITYLQRDAGLPQTGQLNAATSAALAHFLATGNSQMTAA